MPKRDAIKVLCLTTIFLVALNANTIGRAVNGEPVERQLLDGGHADLSETTAHEARRLSKGSSQMLKNSLDTAVDWKLKLSDTQIKTMTEGNMVVYSFQSSSAKTLQTRSNPIPGAGVGNFGNNIRESSTKLSFKGSIRSRSEVITLMDKKIVLEESPNDMQNSLLKTSSVRVKNSSKDILKGSRVIQEDAKIEAMRQSLKDVPLDSKTVDEVLLRSKKLVSSKSVKNSDQQIDEFLATAKDCQYTASVNVASEITYASIENEQTFQGDIPAESDIFEICDRQSIMEIAYPKGLTSYTWVDKYYAFYFLDRKVTGREYLDPKVAEQKAKERAKRVADKKAGKPVVIVDPNAPKRARDQVDSVTDLEWSLEDHGVFINEYKALLNQYADSKVVIYGTTYLDIRIRHVINIIRSNFGFNAIAFSEYEALHPNWAVTLKGDELNVDTINYMSEICQKDFDYDIPALEKDYPEPKQFYVNLKTVWPKFLTIRAGIKLELCMLVETILFVYAGEESLKTVRTDYLSDNKSGLDRLKQGADLEIAEAYFSKFRYLLDDPERPADCNVNIKGSTKNNARTIQESIQFARIGRILTSEFIFKAENEFYGERFFELMLTMPTGNFQKLIEGDLILFRKVWTTSPLMDLFELSRFPFPFHAEFFADILGSKFMTYDNNKLEVPHGSTISKLFMTLYYDEEQRKAGEESGDLDMYLADVLVYLYKMYVIVRGTPELQITQTSTVTQIYEAMFMLLKMDLEIYGEFFVQAQFSRYLTTILTFLCGKIDASYCSENDFKQTWEKVSTDPGDDPTPPKIKGKIVIYKILIKIIETYKRQSLLNQFIVDWNKHPWNVECPQKSNPNVFQHKFIQKKIQAGKLVVQETKDVYWEYNYECTQKLYLLVEEQIRTFLLTTWKTYYFEDWYAVFLTLSQGQDRLRVELVRYILIRIIRLYIQDKTVVPTRGTHLYTFIVTLLHYYEKQLLSSLNLFDTAGFYGIFDLLMNGSELAAKHYSTYFQIERFDSQMVKFDFYYLVQMAYLQTNIEILEPQKRKLWDKNTVYMNFNKEKFFAAFNKPGETDTLDSLHKKVINCRKHKFYGTEEKENVQCAVQECHSLDSKNQPIIPPIKDKRRTSCTAQINDYADCDAGFALKLLDYLLTAHIMFKSVKIFDNFNYYHHYYLVDEQGAGSDTKHTAYIKQTGSKNFVVASYKHLQMIRKHLEGQIDDVPSYAMSKIQHCVSLDKLYTKEETKKGFPCKFGPELYAQMFWVFRHAYIVNYGGQAFNLEPWSPDLTPMGTSNYFKLIVNNQNMSDDFDGLCDQNEETEKTPDICKIKYLMDFWILELTGSVDAIDAEEGLTKIAQIFLTKSEAQEKINSAEWTIEEKKALMSRNKFIIFEAYTVMYQLFNTNLSVLTRLKASLNYYDVATNSKDLDIASNFLASIKAFEMNADTPADDIKYFAKIIRMNFRKFNVDENEIKIRKAITMILDAGSYSYVDKDALPPKTITSSIFKDSLDIQGHSIVESIYMFMRYGNTNEHYMMIAQLIAELKAFLDVVTFETKKDTTILFMGELNGCKDEELGECFLSVQKEILAERMVSVKFEKKRAQTGGKDADDIGDFSNSMAFFEKEEEKSELWNFKKDMIIEFHAFEEVKKLSVVESTTEYDLVFQDSENVQKINAKTEQFSYDDLLSGLLEGDEQVGPTNQNLEVSMGTPRDNTVEEGELNESVQSGFQSEQQNMVDNRYQKSKGGFADNSFNSMTGLDTKILGVMTGQFPVNVNLRSSGGVLDNAIQTSRMSYENSLLGGSSDTRASMGAVERDAKIKLTISDSGLLTLEEKNNISSKSKIRSKGFEDIKIKSKGLLDTNFQRLRSRV